MNRLEPQLRGGGRFSHRFGQRDRSERITEDTVHHRIKGVITRRLRKVGHASRSELRWALESRQRPEFPAVFDSLVAQSYLVTVEGKVTHWRLANP